MIWCLALLLGVRNSDALELVEGKYLKAFIEMGEIQTFNISKTDLVPLSRYEIRVSYLGTFGCSFSINWACPLNYARKLLDTEKIVFNTDEQGKIIQGCHEISVKALRNTRGISKEYSNQPVWYIIKLEKYSDIIPVPNSVIPLVIGVLIALTLSAAFYVFLVNRFSVKSDKKLINKEN